MRRRFTLPLLLLGLLTLPVAADPDPNILYTTRKEFVRVSPARPLTLNAHIDNFAYDPLGLEVACTGQEISGEQVTYFVKTLDVRTGKELHRLTLTVPQYTEARFDLRGWTPSGKYLLLERTQPKDDGSSESATDFVRWDLSADPPKVRSLDTAAYVPDGMQGLPIYGYPLVSPDRRWVMFRQTYKAPDTDGKMGAGGISYVLYDPEQDTFRLLVLPSKAACYGWADKSHLGFWVKENRRQIDVVTGQISLAPAATAAPLPASRQYPDLTIGTEDKIQRETEGSGQFPSRIVWVRSVPRLKQPLSSVGAGVTMGEDDPQAVWSPTGKQIAYLNHGDLYVSDVALVPSDGLAEEKMALGLPLTCREERMLASSDLKQIGLGIMQYTQDYDETFPPAEGVDEALLPYIKDRHVFGIGTVHWNYHTPENLSLAAMDAPADYVMGTIDLPCGQIVLYGDGHVKEMTKE